MANSTSLRSLLFALEKDTLDLTRMLCTSYIHTIKQRNSKKKIMNLVQVSKLMYCISLNGYHGYKNCQVPNGANEEEQNWRDNTINLDPRTNMH